MPNRLATALCLPLFATLSIVCSGCATKPPAVEIVYKSQRIDPAFFVLPPLPAIPPADASDRAIAHWMNDMEQWAKSCAGQLYGVRDALTPAAEAD